MPVRACGHIDRHLENGYDFRMHFVKLVILSLGLIGCNGEAGRQMNEPDPDFGEMKFNGIDAWDCRIDFGFPHEMTNGFAVHVWAPEEGPTENQRTQFRELKRRYVSLWPEIASRIAGVHDRLQSSDDVADAMSDWVAVHLGEHAEDSVEFVITLNLPEEGSRGYFVPLTGWEVGDVVVAD